MARPRMIKSNYTEKEFSFKTLIDVNGRTWNLTFYTQRIVYIPSRGRSTTETRELYRGEHGDLSKTASTFPALVDKINNIPR